MLLVCIRSYLKSVLRHKFLIFDACHPETLYSRNQGCEDTRLLFEAKRGRRVKGLGNTSLSPFVEGVYCVV